MSKPKTILVHGREFKISELAIEPSRTKYGPPVSGFALYAYGTYPRSSVLAGQTSRTYLEGADTETELLAKYPGVRSQGSGYIDPDTVMPSGSPSDYEEPFDEGDY
jgi:hypothetical protein